MLILAPFILLLLLGLPVTFVMGLTVFINYLVEGVIPATVIPQRMFAGATIYSLLAIPFFIFAGNLMNSSGITQRVIDISRVFVGTIRGGLAIVNVIASMFFGGVSGAANADTAAIGQVLIPAMKKEGYDAEFSAAITVASSVVGPVIPPSIAAVTYGVLAEVSIGALFMAGAVPGILLGLVLIGISAVIAKKRNYPRFERRLTMAEMFNALRRGILALFMPIIILGGILGGFFTPTEAAGIAAAYAFVVGFFVYRELTIKDLFAAAEQTAKLSALILMILATAMAFSWILTYAGIPQAIVGSLTSLTDSRIVILLIVNGVMLLLGMVLDPQSALIILVPIFVPLAQVYDIHLVHLGIIMVLNLTVGLITPPVGTCLFTACAIGKVSIYRLVRYGMALPFAGIIAVLLFVTYQEWIVAALPRFLGIY